MTKRKNGYYVKAKTPESIEKQKATIARYYSKKKKIPNVKTDDDVDVLIKRHNDRNQGHYHVILEDIDDKHVSVGLTTDSKKGKNSTNYKMEKSPFKDSATSYMRRQGTVANIKEYSGLYKGVFTKKDYERAKTYGNRAKQKYIENKKK